MQNLIIVYVNNMIHHATEILYYIKEKEYQIVYEMSLSFLEEVKGYFDKAVKMQFNESIELLEPTYNELKSKLSNLNVDNGDLETVEKKCMREFIKRLSGIAICLLENYEWKLHNYYNENMDALLESDNENNKKLYRYLNKNEKNVSGRCELNICTTGDLSLSVYTEDYGKVRICSSGNPWQEALMYMGVLKTAGKNKIKNIMLLGFGLGYHVQCLVKEYPDSNITILENDLEQLRIAFTYRDFRELIANKKVNIIYCENPKKYSVWFKKLERIYLDTGDDGTVFGTWKPSIKTIQNHQLRKIIENYQVVFESMERMGDLLDANFEQNNKLKDDYIDDIKSEIYNKNVIIIAGGPSLDDNIHYLKKLTENEKITGIRKKITIIAVGKISRKLLSEGITPDYIIITDAKSATRWQLKGIEKSGIPLIYISTAAANVVAEYKSKRYIVYQEGVEKAERRAQKRDVCLYQSGGSVTTLALDIAIRQGAKRVICVGTDMGYKGSNTHTLGVGRQIVNEKSLRETEAVGGGKIKTGKTLDIYRCWIEKRIENEKNTEFINSSAGAKINGMKEIVLEEIIAQIEKEKEDG